MLSRFRGRFGLPGVIAVVALVFAMTGGAVAATTVIIKSSKQVKDGALEAKDLSKKARATLKGNRGPAGPKGDAGPAGSGTPGPAGPAGTAGPAGPAGPKGDAGANGANGTNGTNGKTVLNGTGVPSDSLGSNGDFYLDTSTDDLYGPKASGTWPLPPTSLKGAKGDKGDTGDPWTAGGTLPSGKTETGNWAFNASTTTTVNNGIFGPSPLAYVPISFNVPLSAAIPGDNVLFTGDTGFSTHCTGTGAQPTADAGFLCVYLSGGSQLSPDLANATFSGALGDPATGEYYTSGAILAFLVSGDNAGGFGSWAVTAP